MNDLITIQISEYLTHELVKKIAAFRWNNCSPKNINVIRRFVHDGKYFSDCFTVIATNSQNDVIGHLCCLKNQINPKHWYYGDLSVDPVYRRLKVASKMIDTAIQRISDLRGETICCYVKPTNIASINLQKSLSFVEAPYEKFDNLITDGLIMFKKFIGPLYNINRITAAEAIFVHMLYCMNKKTIYGSIISLDEWKNTLLKLGTDEAYFLVCHGAIPCALLNISGFNNKDKAQINMLIVSDKHRHQGIGTFAVEFAEKHIKLNRINKIEVKTTEDNVIAQELFKKCGYTAVKHGEFTTGDGVLRQGFSFVKVIQ